MNIKVQKQDGSTVDVTTDKLGVYRIIENEDIPTGTNNPYPKEKNALIIENVQIATAGYPDYSDNKYIDANKYGILISLNTKENECIQLYLSGIHSSENYTCKSYPIWIRSTQDHVQSGVTKGWTEWRRFAFYDEVEEAKTTCPFPVGFSFVSFTSMDISKLVGGTWKKEASYSCIAMYSNSESVTNGPRYFTYTRTA